MVDGVQHCWSQSNSWRSSANSSKGFDVATLESSLETSLRGVMVSKDERWVAYALERRGVSFQRGPYGGRARNHENDANVSPM
jgi:hypothetical protein